MFRVDGLTWCPILCIIVLPHAVTPWSKCGQSRQHIPLTFVTFGSIVIENRGTALQENASLTSSWDSIVVSLDEAPLALFCVASQVLLHYGHNTGLPRHEVVPYVVIVEYSK